MRLSVIEKSLNATMFRNKYAELTEDHMMLIGLFYNVLDKCKAEGFSPPYVTPFSAEMPWD